MREAGGPTLTELTLKAKLRKEGILTSSNMLSSQELSLKMTTKRHQVGILNLRVNIVRFQGPDKVLGWKN